MIRFASRSFAQSGEGQDRIKVVRFDSQVIAAVLADGARTLSGGARAAEHVVENLSQSCPKDFGALFDAVLALDYTLKADPIAGLSTFVSVYTNGLDFIGAVVGDSDALLIRGEQVSNLAPEKELLPLLGDGEAFPTVFTGTLEDSILLLCSDGLSKYISASDVLTICSHPTDPAAMADKLVNAVELPDGQQQDDISVIVIRADL